MGHEWVLWVLVSAAALHVVEEHALGWQGWAAGYIGARIGAVPRWTDFWATNALLIVFGVSAAVVGWRAPAFALAFPALCLVNAVLFHFVPTLQAGRLNPGCITAAILYVPIGVWVYAGAADDGVLGAGSLLLSLLLGAILMAAAVAMLALHPRLGYPDAAELPGDPRPPEGPTAGEGPTAPGL